VHGAGGVKEWHYTLRDLGGKVLRQFDDFQNGALHAWTWKEDWIYRDGALLAAETSGPERTLHFHLDHLGTPRMTSNFAGTQVSAPVYDPFGQEVTPWTGGEPMKFTGHERDKSLDYMHARYYLAAAGRFTSVDKAGGLARQPQSLNRFSYSGNNPMKFLDPSGLFFVLYNEADRQFYRDAIRKGTANSSRQSDFLALANDPRPFLLTTAKFAQSSGMTTHATADWFHPRAPFAATITVDRSSYGGDYVTPTITMYHELFHLIDHFWLNDFVKNKFGDDTNLTASPVQVSVFEQIGINAETVADDPANALTDEQIDALLVSYSRWQFERWRDMISPSGKFSASADPNDALQGTGFCDASNTCH
jgi:RHS repeat-associated protein